MKGWKKIILIATITILTPLCYNSTALSQNVLAGVDLWETQPGDATYQFGGGNECPPIPADFFAPGSDPFIGSVSFQGQPLQTIPAGILGSTDTIIERLHDAVLPQCPSTDIIDIEIVALNLVSVQPITVTYSGGMNPELWDVQMCLSGAVSQQTGSMTVNQDCDDGGSFTAQIPVTPRFTFTKVSNPIEIRIYDYGYEVINPIPYSIADGHWLYADPGFSVKTSPGGVLVDHDCDGMSDVAVGSSSNFYPGLQATPCHSCPGATPTYSMVMTLWQSPTCGTHGVYPPQSIPEPTIFPEVDTECPESFTLCPEYETWCPILPTSCPDIPTVQPEVYTLCPEVVTVCSQGSDVLTSCPLMPTYCDPSLPTLCPYEWTNCPGGFTLCPEIPTICPDSTPTICKLTLCPDDQTYCGPIETVCPLEPTFCELMDTFCGPFTQCQYPCTEPTLFPDIPTECPTRWTFCPEEPTWCPVIKTICPDDDPTFCSQGIPTICPTGDFTWCPEIPTQCPQLDTWCPDNLATICEITACPLVGTMCPLDPTTCPPNQPTVCPVVTTQCPVVTTQCPAVTTECPVVTTQCPLVEPCCVGCQADLDCDGKVGLSDLVIMKTEFGMTGCDPNDPQNCCQADIDGNGKVGLSDLVIMKGEFGENNCCPCTPPCTFP